VPAYASGERFLLVTGSAQPVRGAAVAAVQDGTPVHIDLWGQAVAATARRV
jgi:hypothetical protein